MKPTPKSPDLSRIVHQPCTRRSFLRAGTTVSLGLLHAGPAALSQTRGETFVRPVEDARTSLANGSFPFVVPDLPYTVLRRGSLEAVVVDNRAVDDEVLPGHRAGYHGLGSLRHTRQERTPFVPAYAGLNFEHIHDGTTQAREVLFEPRHAPMELRRIDPFTAELYQTPTPHWGLESCMRYELIGDELLELTFECIPRRDTFKNPYIGLFWASYIHQPESKEIQFRGRTEADSAVSWIRASSPRHGVRATHRSLEDHRRFRHDSDFPLSLVFNFSPYRYSEPWYLGVCREMAYVPLFRTADHVRFSQSPSGGGVGNPAWDFQWLIPHYEVGKRYRLVMRLLYTVHETEPGTESRSGPPGRIAEQIDNARGF